MDKANNTKTNKTYKVIVADPPWSKNQKGSLGAQKHYDLMSMREILNLPVGDLRQMIRSAGSG